MTTIPSNKVTQLPIQLEYGHCSKQGFRPTMEDRVILRNNFMIENCQYTSGILSLFAVFDGHGGKQCSNYCASFFPTILTINLTTVYDANTKPINNGMKEVFIKSISDLDDQCLSKCTDGSGSTACIILIDRITGDIWCCNVGDSRCIFINNDLSNVTQFSTEHKPEFQSEKLRIENANGWVNNGRVCGILSVSRSLGDKDFKQDVTNLIISTPDINHYNITPNAATMTQEYMILACDGLYDVFTNENACQWMKTHVKKRKKKKKQLKTELPYKSASDLDSLCADIITEAIQKRFSGDNVSVIIVRFDEIPSHIKVNDVNVNISENEINKNVEEANTNHTESQNNVDNQNKSMNDDQMLNNVPIEDKSDIEDG